MRTESRQDQRAQVHCESWRPSPHLIHNHCTRALPHAHISSTNSRMRKIPSLIYGCTGSVSECKPEFMSGCPFQRLRKDWRGDILYLLLVGGPQAGCSQGPRRKKPGRLDTKMSGAGTCGRTEGHRHKYEDVESHVNIQQEACTLEEALNKQVGKMSQPGDTCQLSSHEHMDRMARVMR